MNSKPPKKILVIDDEPEICWIIKQVLTGSGYEVELAFDGERGIETLERMDPNLVLLDIRLPGRDGLEILKDIKAKHPQLPVVMLSAFENVEAAVRAMKLGAYDYLSKPLNVDELMITLKNALQTRDLMAEVSQLRQEIANHHGEQMLWASPAMRSVMELVGRIAPYDVTVLIQGESGTGKDLLAQFLHSHSPRAAGPFVSIDCGALPETLVESELFGFERGAFTGATERKPGRIEQAEGGTLFLDEIGNLSPATQVKLLRLLQERRLQRLGGKEEIEINVRLVTASNTDLTQAQRSGSFREDLYHRLNEFRVTLPPLRERPEDIELLARHFLDRYNRQLNKSIRDLAVPVLEAFRRYAWPGNVRELMHAMKRAVVLAGDQIELEHVPTEILAPSELVAVPAGVAAAGESASGPRPLRELCQEASRRVEREAILKALSDTRWNKVKAAKLLKINYKTLFNKMKQLDI